MVSAAGGALGIAGVFTLAGALLFAVAGGSGYQVALVVVFGVALLVVAVLVYRHVPIGRQAGLMLASLGLVFGVSRLIGGSGNAAVDLFAYCFVIWALATSRDAFRQG
jgi:hypothetical protein